MYIDYIKCHGSGNEFVMVDATTSQLEGVDLALFARTVCNREESIGGDGVLLLCKRGDTYGMRMFNPDGSEAEMCGNGIRCVARLADEIKGCGEQFDMWSGSNIYNITRQTDIYEGIPTYGVNLAVSLQSSDFGFSGGKEFIEGVIPSLDDNLRWSAINVGNPHIIAEVESIDYNHLEQLGERVKMLREEFPRGINISLVQLLAKNRIFVATYERGAGITASCGTAMTSSATAMALNRRCDYGSEILVENRGGAVRCICRNEGGLRTQLIGNASYISRGVIGIEDEGVFRAVEQSLCEDEIALYNEFLQHYKG